MRSAAIASTAFAAAALAAPAQRRQDAKGGPSDATILNYALTLEHLESAFYNQTLEKFSEADFKAYGLDNVFYTNLMAIRDDEATHVTFLETALTAANATPVLPNEYDFGLTDIATFLATANILEGVGVSAYLGAAQYIADATYLTAAGAILTVEARHNALLREVQTPQEAPNPAPFDIPLDFNEVVTLAAPFITALNPKNPPLPVNGFPAITASPATEVGPGDKVTLTVAKSVDAVAAYFVTVTGSLEAPLTGSGKDYVITVPVGAPMGQSYVVLTKEKGTVSDDIIVAGPAVVAIKDAQFGVIPDETECAVSATPYKTSTWEQKPTSTWEAKPYETVYTTYETTVYETKTYTSVWEDKTSTWVATSAKPTWYSSSAKPTWTSESKPTWTSESKPTWTSSEVKPTWYPSSSSSWSAQEAQPTWYPSESKTWEQKPSATWYSTSSEDCEETPTPTPSATPYSYSS